MMAYKVAKEHVRTRLVAARADSNVDAFTLFEEKLLEEQLMDTNSLTGELNALAQRFRQHYGERFCL
jgi:hypothetical protein